MRLLSVSSNRADLNMLTPIWEALRQEPSVDLTTYRLKPMLPGTSPLATGRALARVMRRMTRLYETVNPDVLMLPGDRLEMSAVALASVPFNIPIVHLQGGEITAGAMDDRLRHFLTKLSHIHCVTTPQAARRVHQMGEEPWRIHVTGSAAIDGLVQAPVMSRQAVMAALGFA